MKTISEIYEDNAGGLHIFALAGPDCVPVYYSYHTPGDAYEAAQEWATILTYGVDRHWTSSSDPEEVYDELCDCKIIGCSKWRDDPYGVDLDCCCSCGQEFAVALGAAYECPQCGSLQRAVRNAHYPDDWANPERCEACGAVFEG